MKRFKHKTVIVTGGAQGIGAAICQSFASEGANVVIVDVNEGKGKELEKKMIAKDQKAYFLKTDVSQEKPIKQMMVKIAQRYSSLNILVNCAARFIMKGIEAVGSEWQEMFMTNVVGYALCAKYFSEKASGNNNSIINIASISGFQASKGRLLYNTTKGALVSMVRCLAIELAEKKIRVNNICPGTVWTSNNAYFINKRYGVNKIEANNHPAIGQKSILNRVAEPEEIARVVLFLASEDASFITAENIIVDGGQLVKEN